MSTFLKKKPTDMFIVLLKRLLNEQLLNVAVKTGCFIVKMTSR